jgi:hypothetical protein
MKKALLVGINYKSIQGAALNGCINDIVNISEVLIDTYDYYLKDIIQLRDDVNNSTIMPTRANILTCLSALVAQSANLSELWFHYSGHGSQIRDMNGDETDRLDEVLVPVDFQKSGFIVDDEIFSIVKNSKCKTILIFDSCHSGSMCDLQWNYQYTNGSILKTMTTNKMITNPNVFCFSGCKDPETSADAYSAEKKMGVGAFTDTFIRCLRANRMNVDILKLYSDISVAIKQSGFTQSPSFSCSSPSPSYKFVRVTNTPVVENNVKVVDVPVDQKVLALASASVPFPVQVKPMVSTKDIINFQVKVDVPPSIENAINTFVFAFNQIRRKPTKVKMTL